MMKRRVLVFTFAAVGSGGCSFGSLRSQPAERMVFVRDGASHPGRPVCRWTDQAAAALAANGYARIGLLFHRATGQTRAEVERRAAEEAARRGGELMRVLRSSVSTSTGVTSETPVLTTSSITGVPAIGRIGGTTYAVSSRVTVAEVWRRGPAVPPTPPAPWLERWRQRRRDQASRCDAGDPHACDALARASEPGTEAHRRHRHRTITALGRRCRDRDAAACLSLAFAGGGDVFGGARSLYKRACSLGSAAGCDEWLWREKPRGAELTTVLGRLDAACDRGEAKACSSLGAHHRKTDSTRGRALRAKARSLYEKGCAAGVAVDCLSAYDATRGRSPDRAAFLTRALLALERGCDRGAVKDCVRMAELYAWPRRDRAAERRAWSRACALQEIEGCVGHARHDADLAQALRTLVSACAEGYAPACASVEARLASEP
jgi:hypothetical protein